MDTQQPVVPLLPPTGPSEPREPREGEVHTARGGACGPLAGTAATPTCCPREEFYPLLSCHSRNGQERTLLDTE